MLFGTVGLYEVPGWLWGKCTGSEKVLEELWGSGCVGRGEGDISTWEDMGTQPAGAEWCSGEGKMWAAGETLGCAVVWGHRGNGGMWGEDGGKRGGAGWWLSTSHIAFFCTAFSSCRPILAHIPKYSHVTVYPSPQYPPRHFHQHLCPTPPPAPHSFPAAANPAPALCGDMGSGGKWG